MGVLDQLGQTVMPAVFSSLKTAGLVDTMDIVGATVSAGIGGGRVKSASPTAYANVPVAYEPITRQNVKRTENDKMTSEQRYKLTFATHLSGSRINLDPKVHRLNVQARGNEPAKTFRIISVGDISGVCFEVECVREN